MEKYPTIQHQGLQIPLKSLAEQRFESPSVSVVPHNELTSFVLDLIAQTYIKCGIKTPDGELSLHTKLFMEELSVFPYITLKELRKCFSDGYKEKYGKYYGLSVKTFVGWVDYYIQNVRNEDLNKAKKNRPKPKNEMSEREKRLLIISGMNKCISFYEENTDILEGYELFLYDVLLDDGFITVSKEEKIKSYEDAKEFLQMTYGVKKTKTKAEFDKLKADLENIEKPKSPIVVKKAKEFIVRRFLRETFRVNDKIVALKNKYKS